MNFIGIVLFHGNKIAKESAKKLLFYDFLKQDCEFW
jgi:hypothetical protein